MYTPRLTPRKHQITALQKVRKRPQRPSAENVFAWLMDMGTGKTKVMIDEFGQLEDAKEMSDLFVIAPAGCYRNWDRDQEDDPGELTKHMAPELRERCLVVPWISGGTKTWRHQLDYMLASQDPSRPRVLVMNIEALSTGTDALSAAMVFMETSRRGVMMDVDESTTIRNGGAARTKNILELGALAKARRIATGLITPRSPMDLFTQFGFLDWRILGHRSFHSFRHTYAVMRQVVMGSRRFWVEVAYRNVGELTDRIAPYSYRVLKKDCLDLEPKVYTSRDVKLTDVQARMYREMKLYATTQLDADNHVTATHVIVQLTRIDQMLSGFVVTESGEIRDIPENRTAEVLDILEEHQGKAIIWVAYDHALRKLADAIEKRFGEGSVARFWGGNASTRLNDERRFKTDPKCQFMISTPGAGGRGNTWVVANLVIYHSNDYDLEHRDQSEDRPHRDGQTERVTYVDLIARGTTDEKKVLSLRKKINMATTINGENYREWLI